MNELIKVKDNPDLARVGDSAVIINQNQEGFHQYLAHRNKILEEKQTVVELKQQVDDLTALVNKLIEGKKTK